MDNDVDMMEIDDDQLDHSKAVARLQSGTIKRALDQPDCSIGSRKRIRGKRLINRSTGEFIIVLDTNILIEHLTDLKKFLSNTHLTESCTLIIPFIVIQELDLLKKRNHSYVQNFKFINEQLLAETVVFSDKVWLKKQSQDAVKKATAEVDLIEFNSDDIILKNSLLIHEICQKSSGTVMLITDDLNLRNKALASALKALDWDGFCDKFGIERTNKKKTIKSTERPAIKKLQKCNNLKADKATSSQTKGIVDSSTIDTMQFGDWLTLKYSAEIKLRVFLEKVLRREYNDLWDKIFKIDLSSCTLFEMIRCIKQGWLGTFSDIFDRDKSVLETLEKLVELLKKEKDISEITALMYYLLEPVNKISDLIKSELVEGKTHKSESSPS